MAIGKRKEGRHGDRHRDHRKVRRYSVLLGIRRSKGLYILELELERRRQMNNVAWLILVMSLLRAGEYSG
jgi:hypothetical protein